MCYSGQLWSFTLSWFPIKTLLPRTTSCSITEKAPMWRLFGFSTESCSSECLEILNTGTGLLSKRSKMVIIAKYGFSTTIPALSFKSLSEVTTNAAALDEAISFLYLSKNANAIDLFEADFKSSTVEIAILP